MSDYWLTSLQIKKAITENISGKYHNLLLVEVDSEFDFFNDVQPACIDWDNYYEHKDFNEGNEAVVSKWKLFIWNFMFDILTSNNFCHKKAALFASFLVLFIRYFEFATGACKIIP